MANKRVPLSNVPNAANSPFRAVTAAASKRSREQLEAQEDLSYDVQPRAKRQALQDARSNQRTPPRRQALQSAEDRVFNKRPTNAQPTAFERKLLAAREDKSKQRVHRQDKASNEQRGDVRQWQKHYKKLFPSFVFYFESVPEDVRIYCSKHVRSLGAREEKFFSREVTHVITTRQIPVDNDSKDLTDLAAPSSTSTSSQPSNAPRTINPSLLDRHSDHHGEPPQPKNRFMFEANASKRAPLSNARDVEPRKSAGNTDILSRAREMGMKVWPLDKLQRAIRTMFEIPNESQLHAGQGMRAKGTTALTKGDREAELSRMLRNERIHGPSDRDSSIALNETVPFKGYHIYIREMDERTKPIMVRDYSKPVNDEISEWPQFQCVSTGKCPFIPEPDPPTRQEHEKAKAREEEIRRRSKIQAQPAPRTRAAAIRDDAEAQSVKEAAHYRPLEELKDGGNASAPPPARMPSQDFCPPPQIIAKNASPAKVTRESIANTGTRLFGGEPAASGMQPSNLTSAIRSQMISSTAAGPGAKAGTSKEVHGLKRKVLEKNSGPAPTGIQTRHRTVDLIGDGRAEKTKPTARHSRRRAQETLIHIDEETTQSEADEDVWMAEDVRTKRKQPKEALEKNAKPGYCENCREKYDDFDDHIIGRKHRKFALTQEHWKDLDRLLSHLGRRLKEQDSDDF